MDQIEVSGLRIAFRRQGAGPALVLVHGALCDGRVWRTQMDALSDEFDVVAWDAPGCGESSDPPDTFRLGEYADCLAGFVAGLRLDGRVHVLGHSWGSGLALELYRRHPRIPASLVLVGAYAGWAGSLPRDEVARRLEVALRVADLMPDRFWPSSVPGLFSDAMPAERADELSSIMAEARPPAARTMARAFAEADLREMLGEVDVPTLVLVGDGDERSPLHVAQELHRNIPGSELVVLPELGHECYLESPDMFDTAVRSFLRRHGLKARPSRT